MALHLIRHPRPAVDASVCYGRLDLALASPIDAAAVAAVRRQLPGESGLRFGARHGRRLISSPARRCIELARVLADDFTTDPAWQELDFGAWEGRRWAAIDRSESDPWADDVWHRAPPGGETWAALTARVRGAVVALLEDLSRAGRPVLEGTSADAGIDADAGAEIAVVTHAGPIRAVHAWVEGLDPQVFPTLPLGFGQVVSVDWARVRAAVACRDSAAGLMT